MPEGDLFNFERFFGLCFIRSEQRGGGSSPKWVAANSAWTLHVGGVEITPPGTSWQSSFKQTGDLTTLKQKPCSVIFSPPLSLRLSGEFYDVR